MRMLSAQSLTVIGVTLVLGALGCVSARQGASGRDVQFSIRGSSEAHHD